MLRRPALAFASRWARASPSTRRISSGSLFDPAVYLPTRAQLDKARTLPGELFHSERWYNEEVKHLLGPSWVLAGRKEEVNKPGSFIRIDLPGGASALVVRGKDNEIRAWANICTHRGAALTREESGRFAGGIVCPYRESLRLDLVEARTLHASACPARERLPMC